jgi:lipoprotein-anchoring transpeptidase ErfK/SrfK
VFLMTRAARPSLSLKHLFSAFSNWHVSCNLFGRWQKRDRVGDAMNGMNKWAMAVSAAAVLGVHAMGQQAATVQVPTVQTSKIQATPVAKQVTTPQTTTCARGNRVIVVSLEDRKLALLEDGQVKKVYTVAVGKPTTPSPSGTFTIARRVKNPTYSHNGKTVLPGPGNPVGTRWMGLSVKGYGIHGTNEPKSIGKAASHGCIRMAQKDLEEMYELVSVGETVELVGQRNEETAQLFGGEQKPVVGGAQEPMVMASIAQGATTTTTEVADDGVAVTGNW